MIWKGHVSFGLVNLPVALHPAVTRDELDFTLLDKKDLSPIGYRKVNKRTGEAVPGTRITRGLEQEKGRCVIVSDDDLRRASPERTRRIDILSFTDPAAVDPIYYDHPYYLAPTARNEKGIHDMTEPWDPTKYRDEYRQELRAFIRKRAKTGRTEEAPGPAASEPRKGEVIDLMELLTRSVERRGKASPGKRRSGVRAQRTA